jgi:thiol-disulfide isomerase/thioredoxin/uncharacterized membrane protein YphA (DoxX/SURF4 family)
MNKFVQNKWFPFGCRLLLGVILFVASFLKILDMSSFVDTVVGYHLIPDNLAQIYGWAIPWVELYLGASIILGVLPRISAAISIPLIASFAIASTYALEKAPGSTCGCFGSFITLSHPVSLIIDGVMFLAALVILTNKGPEFLTLGQQFNRINPTLREKKKASYFVSLVGIVALVMAAVAAISYVVDSLASIAETSDITVEQVSIPSPISDKISTPLQRGTPVLLYMFAEGCSACETTQPVLEEVVAGYSDKISYIKVDYYQYTGELIEMGIVSTPTIWLITGKNQDGSFDLLERFGGSIEREGLRNAIDKALNLFP